VSDPRGEAQFGSLTSGQVAALDQAAVACGVDILQLMEVAGWQVARCAWGLLGAAGAVHVLAGRGNNGGDALVAARHLATWGCDVSVHVLTEPERLTGLVARHAASARECGVAVVISDSVAPLPAERRSPRLLLDGLLGTGLASAPREPQASAIQALNSCGLRVLSIDVPSGLDGSTGAAPGACIRAAATCTLAAMKRGLWTEVGLAHAGQITVADIGMPAAAWKRCGLTPPSRVRGGALVPL